MHINQNKHFNLNMMHNFEISWVCDTVTYFQSSYATPRRQKEADRVAKQTSQAVKISTHACMQTSRKCPALTVLSWYHVDSPIIQQVRDSRQIKFEHLCQIDSLHIAVIQMDPTMDARVIHVRRVVTSYCSGSMMIHHCKKTTSSFPRQHTGGRLRLQQTKSNPPQISPDACQNNWQRSCVHHPQFTSKQNLSNSFSCKAKISPKNAKRNWPWSMLKWTRLLAWWSKQLW